MGPVGAGPLPDRARATYEWRECVRMGLPRMAYQWAYHLRWLDWYEGLTDKHPGPPPGMSYN